MEINLFKIRVHIFTVLAYISTVYSITSMFRTQAGRLHLVDSVGKISLADVSLVEDPSEEERNDDGKLYAFFLRILTIVICS